MRAKMMIVVLLAILAGAAAQARQTPTGGGQGPGSPAKARIDAFFQALASGDPAKYEAMAREHFTPDTWRSGPPNSAGSSSSG